MMKRKIYWGDFASIFCLGAFMTFLLMSCVDLSTMYQIKFYGSDRPESQYYINNTRCLQELAKVTHPYMEEIKFVRFHATQNIKRTWFVDRFIEAHVMGTYQTGRIIDIYGGCNDDTFDTLVHELAHHCQLDRGDNIWVALEHKGQFDECYDEIYEHCTSE